MSSGREDDPPEPGVSPPGVRVVAQVRDGPPVHVGAEPITERAADREDVPAAAPDVHGSQEVSRAVWVEDAVRVCGPGARVAGRRERDGGDGRARRGGQAPTRAGTLRQAKHVAAPRHGSRLQRVSERKVLENRRIRVGPLPDVVVAAAPHELINRRRSALHRRVGEHERLVDQDSVESKLVEIGVGPLCERLAVEQGNEAPPALRCPLGVHPPQKVADAVRLGVGHQRRALSREAMADCLQLGQLSPRRQPDIRVRKPVRPQDADGDRERL